jgi:uncharacterized protein (TIGR00251 family)
MKSSSDGVTIRLKVVPGAGREGISRGADGGLRLAVTAAPERGKANAAAAALLARALGVPKSSVAVVQGATARDKTLRITGNAGTLAPRIEALGRG